MRIFKNIYLRYIELELSMLSKKKWIKFIVNLIMMITAFMWTRPCSIQCEASEWEEWGVAADSGQELMFKVSHNQGFSH